MGDINPGSYVDWDVKDHKRDILEDRYRLWEVAKRWLTIWDCQIPIIAQVHGYCIAGGTDLALCCDLVVASDDAKFGHPGVRGIGTPISAPWTYLVGPMRSKMLLLTGDTISGKQAAEWGLISKSVPPKELEQETLRLANRLAAIPRDIKTINKLVCNRALENMGFRDSIRDTCDMDSMSHYMPTVKTFWEIVRKEGIKAALKWRDRDFEGLD